MHIVNNCITLQKKTVHSENEASVLTSPAGRWIIEITNMPN